MKLVERKKKNKGKASEQQEKEGKNNNKIDGQGWISVTPKKLKFQAPHSHEALLRHLLTWSWVFKKTY